jgi:hypothetical protein
MAKELAWARSWGVTSGSGRATGNNDAAMRNVINGAWRATNRLHLQR